MNMDDSFLNVLVVTGTVGGTRRTCFFDLMNMAKREILIYVLLLFGSFVPIMVCDGGVVVVPLFFCFCFSQIVAWV